MYAYGFKNVMWVIVLHKNKKIKKNKKKSNYTLALPLYNIHTFRLFWGPTLPYSLANASRFRVAHTRRRRCTLFRKPLLTRLTVSFPNVSIPHVRVSQRLCSFDGDVISEVFGLDFRTGSKSHNTIYTYRKD